MTEEKTAEPEVQKEDTQALPDQVTVEVRKGQKATFDRDKAQDLIRKGIGYDKATQEYAEFKKSNADAIALGQELLEIKNTDPAMAARIAAVVNGQDTAPSPSVVPDVDQLDPEAMSDGERAALAKTRALEAQLAKQGQLLERISNDLTTRSQGEQQSALERQIAAEAGSISHWDAQDVSDFTPQIAAYMSQNEGASVTEAVHVMARADADRMARKQEARMQTAEKGLHFALAPSEGTPNAASKAKPPQTSDSLMKGDVLKHVFKHVLGRDA